MDKYSGAYDCTFIGGNGRNLTATVADNVLHIVAAQWIVDGINCESYWRNTVAHTYTDCYGAMQQFALLTASVDGTKDGNYRNRTHEAWNPPESDGDLNLSLYTPEQCERFADFLAEDHRHNGAILADMHNSLPSSHGVGAHRYGIIDYPPHNQVGGEVWSNSANKVCPGTERVKQIPAICARAQWLVDHNVPPLPVGRVDIRSALARGGIIVPPEPQQEDDMMIVRRAVEEDHDYMWAPDYSLFIDIGTEPAYNLMVANGTITVPHGQAIKLPMADINWTRGVCLKAIVVN